MMKKIEELKANKIFKIGMITLKTILFIFLGAFILVVCLQRFSGNKVSFFNYRMFTVISGSMKPKYDIGDVLISEDVAPSKIKVGDDISYLGTRGEFANKVITHEVVSIQIDDNGKYLFRSKGLANLVEDPVVGEDQIYGKVIYRSIILSLVYRIVSTKIGFYLFIIVPLIFIIGSEIFNTLMSREEQRREKMKKNS